MGLPAVRRRPVRLPVFATLMALLAAGLVAGTASRAAAATESYPLPSSGTITVVGHGNGHGHGMSQYGARGAAAAGLSSSQIVAFYYQHTSLVTLASSTTMRVRLSGGYADTMVRAASGLTLRDKSGALMHGVAQPLPTSGISRYRLAPAGAGLKLQRLAASGWANVGGATALPAQADFVGAQGYVRLYRADGTATDYRDKVGAIRVGTGELTINRVNLERYTMGVAPREMPGSWAAAAVHAQAIAARTYGVYGLVHSVGDPYDICDNDQCQVYGGMRHYDTAGNVVYTDDPATVTGTSYQVLRYAGQTIFAQFSASDGGWTVDGAQPYLAARADPYDNAATGDPYLNWSRSVAVSHIAGYYGLARATKIEITGRDGNGQWGGRVLSGYVDGVDASGATRRIATTGFALQSAMGLPHHWFTIQLAALSAPSAPTAVHAVGTDTGAFVRWSPPSSTGGAPITGYTLSFGTHTIGVSASTRSAFAGPRANGSPARILVRAVNARGAGAAAAVTATPTAAPQHVNPLPAARLFDTRVTRTPVNPAHQFKFDVAGRGGVPASGARAVQLALTILHPTASGVLTVHTWGAAATPVAAIAYHAGVMTTVTVNVPLIPSTIVAFAPSAGSMELLADLMSYSAAGGLEMRSLAMPRLVRTLASVPTGLGVAVAMRAVPGVTAGTTAVVLSVAATTSSTSGWLRLWADGATVPTVNQVSVRPGGANANTVVVPIGSSGSIRLASSSAAIGAKVTLVGVLGPPAVGLGRLESFPPNGIAEGGSALRVGATAQPFTVTGKSQVPASGVGSVLLHVTVTPRSGSGSLWVYAAGKARPTSPAMQFGGTTPLTATVLVPVSPTGAITFVTSGPGVSVAVDAIGYVTIG